MRSITIIFLLLIIGLAHAQDSYAAALEITHEGLEIRLNGTESWLRLSDGAVTAFGAGDMLRSNEFGRGRLHFGETASLLILPNSEFRLDAYDAEQLQATFLGTAILQASGLSSIEIQLQDIALIALQGSAGLWSSPNQPDIVTLADGLATVRSGDTETELASGEGFRDTAEGGEIATLETPYSAARLIGILDGCSGIVQTGELAGVRVRTGAGRGYQQRGLIDNGNNAVLLGQTETSGWTRIQYASGFAWISSFALETDCVLPILPDDAPEEDITRVVNGDEQELALLLSYFGSPLFDGFFYGFEN
jgi:hypothetical protein